MTRPGIPERLLQRLDELGAALADRGDVVALIALGSVGVELDRLDDHSDLDFFVIVDDDARQRYLDSIDWLEELFPVAFSFPNTVDGRKVLFADGLYGEYAVFTVAGVTACAAPAGRLVWQRADAPAGLDAARGVPASSPHDTVQWQANEALTNLYVALHRLARGELLSAMRLIQVHAVDRVLTIAGLHAGGSGQQDLFAVERGAERRFGVRVPFASMVPGYDRNRDAALAILAWLEAHADVDPVLAGAIRELAESDPGSTGTGGQTAAGPGDEQRSADPPTLGRIDDSRQTTLHGGDRMTDQAKWQIARLDDIERRGRSIPVREHLGIHAFGVNGWRTGEDGVLINDHTEGPAGQEELYVVLDGQATFEIDGETVEAPAGTLLYVSPEARRKATGDATILAFGGIPGEAYRGLDWGEAWPFHSESMTAYGEQRYADALQAVRGGLERMPDHPGLHYNYACFSTLAGETDDETFQHLERSIESFPPFREQARADDDLAAVRDDPRFEKALS